jgi:uncharacterized membrane protein
MPHQIEHLAGELAMSISHAVEITASIIIGFAILKVLYRYLSFLVFPARSVSKEAIRVEFGGSVAVALELMLGADVLATAVAPTWSDIGQLAVIAIIRTALNYFLGKELKEISNESNAHTGF